MGAPSTTALIDGLVSLGVATVVDGSTSPAVATAFLGERPTSHDLEETFLALRPKSTMLLVGVPQPTAYVLLDGDELVATDAGDFAVLHADTIDTARAEACCAEHGCEWRMDHSPPWVVCPLSYDTELRDAILSVERAVGALGEVEECRVTSGEVI
jgi:hypothetical protein